MKCLKWIGGVLIISAAWAVGVPLRMYTDHGNCCYSVRWFKRKRIY